MLAFPVVLVEVLDKEPSLAKIWLSHALAAGLAYSLCRKDWRWLFAFFPLSVCVVWFGIGELWDRWVGAAILHESKSLVVQWHIAMALVVAAPAIGLWHGLSRRDG